MQDIDGYRDFRGASIYDGTTHFQWPVSSSRLSPPRARAETASALGTQRALNRGHPMEEVRCHYRDLPTNCTGRSLHEVFADLGALLGNPKSSSTPSLVSDDFPWTSPSTSSFASPISHTHSLSRDVSPPTSPGEFISKGRKRSFGEVEVEDSLVSATQALGIRSASRRLSLDIQVESVIEEPPVIHVVAPPVEEIRDALPELISDPLPSDPSALMLGPRSTMQQLLEAAELQRLDTSYIETNKEPLEEEEENDEAEEMSSPAPDTRSITPNSPALLETPPGRQPKEPKEPKEPKAKIVCGQCTKTFTRPYDLKRHIKSTHDVQSTAAARARTCPVCYATLSRPDSFNRHCAKVPQSCVRFAKLRGKSVPEPRPDDDILYQLCREGKPPLPKWPPPARPSP